MRSLLSGYSCDPWNMPVPVTRSSFIPLRREDATFNVESCARAIEPFAYRSRRVAAGRLLYSDLQTSATTNVPELRLGSGRSGFFAGKYLKGVGRTPLAGNWNDQLDPYHSSGHLLPSAGVREHLVTRYLAANGASDTINGCDGLLISPAPATRIARRMFTTLFPRGNRIPACDLHLAALTVKSSHFARPSNFVWLLNHVYPAPRYLANTFTRLRYYARPTAQSEPLSSCTPASVVEALTSALAQGVRNFQRYFQLGVYWGSFHNNFTLDGRFLDLEVPTVIGRPFFGVLSRQAQRSGPYRPSEEGALVGLELLQYLHQMRSFLRFLRSRIRFLVDEVFRQGVARTFLRELGVGLDRSFPRSHLVFDRGLQARTVLALIGDSLDLSSRQRRVVKALLRWRMRAAGSRPLPEPELALAPVRFQLADAEPGQRYSAYTFQGLMPPGFMPSEGAIELNDSLTRIERTTDPQELLAEVAAAERRIERTEPRQ